MKVYNYVVKMTLGDMHEKNFKEGNLEGIMDGLDENDAKRKIRALVSEQLGITLTVIDVPDDVRYSGSASTSSSGATVTATATATASSGASLVASLSKP